MVSSGPHEDGKLVPILMRFKEAALCVSVEHRLLARELEPVPSHTHPRCPGGSESRRVRKTRKTAGREKQNERLRWSVVGCNTHPRVHGYGWR